MQKLYRKLVISCESLVHCFLKLDLKEAGGGGEREI
jgi:hypothetical protein